jgi:hypothetical protein
MWDGGALDRPPLVGNLFHFLAPSACSVASSEFGTVCWVDRANRSSLRFYKRQVLLLLEFFPDGGVAFTAVQQHHENWAHEVVQGSYTMFLSLPQGDGLPITGPTDEWCPHRRACHWKLLLPLYGSWLSSNGKLPTPPPCCNSSSRFGNKLLENGGVTKRRSLANGCRTSEKYLWL